MYKHRVDYYDYTTVFYSIYTCNIETVSRVGDRISGQGFTRRVNERRERFTASGQVHASGKQTSGEVHASGNARRGKMNVGRGVNASGNAYWSKMNVGKGVHASGSMCTTKSVLLGHHTMKWVLATLPVSIVHIRWISMKFVYGE